MAKKMTKAEHAVWRHERTEELIKVSISLRPHFQFFRTLTIHDKLPWKRIVWAYESVMELVQDEFALIERFEQASECHNEPTTAEIFQDDVILHKMYLAFEWLRAFTDRADNHLSELLDGLHQLGPPTHTHKRIIKVLAREPGDFEILWKTAWLTWDYYRSEQEEAEHGPLGRGVRRACRRD
jgi:hypothetical protein